MTGRPLLLVTGAAGSLGRFLLRDPPAGWDLRLSDLPAAIKSLEDLDVHSVVPADITDPVTMTAACVGVDAVLHLGGIATNAPWPDLLRVNVHGSFTVLDAARRQGVHRFLYASSNHAVGYHRRADQDLAADLAARPDSVYGVSKAAAEVAAVYFADEYAMSVTALRIGSCFERPSTLRELATWLSPADFCRLVSAGLHQTEPGFRQIWGVSANSRRWWSLEDGVKLGYRPVEDAETFSAEIIDPEGTPSVFVGGHDPGTSTDN